MRDDLLESQAAVDWGRAQCQVLQRRVDEWRATDPYSTFLEFDPQRGKNAIKVRVNDPLPLVINAETGAIINSIRSSLDLLAVTLAERNGHLEPKDVYFPVCKSVDSWRSSGIRMIKRLLDADKVEIEKLQPYHRGHDPKQPDTLLALHQLDIERKHRRLVSVHEDLARMNLSGWGLDAEFIPGMPPLEHDAVLAWISPNVTRYELHLAPEVTLRNAAVQSRVPLFSALMEFADCATTIIKQFDS